MSKIFRIAVGIIAIMLLMTGSALGTAPWWDTSRHFRVSVTVGATGFERYEKPAELNVDFTQLFNEVGQTGTLDENSIRVVEVDNIGTILNAVVPFQFDRDSDYNPTTKASGNIVLIMNGTMPANTNRYYYIYFDITGSSFSPPSITSQVAITDNIMDEGQNSYRINATDSTYYFQKDAGGFSSWNDISGNDWINWSTATGTSGVYRGIPNAVYALGIFHPGFTCCTSNIVSQGPIKIRIKSVSNNGEWESIWDMYPRYATMTMTKANNSYGYWMLYEGTPGGTLEPNIDFMFKSNGVKTYLNQSWYSDIASNEWVYFSDPNVGGNGRSLFVTHREDDGKQDMYKSLSYPPGKGLITVFGFGRSDSPVKGLLNSVPQHFTIGLINGTDFTQNSKIIQSTYKDMTVTKGIAEQYGSDNNGNNDVQLTFNSSFDRQPSWSPDGQWVSFVSDRNGNWEIYKVNRNGEGSGLVRLTNYGGFDLEPSWNPNNRIVFAAGSGKGYEDVYVMNNTGTGRQQLTFEIDFDEYADWSPDGSKIVYTSVGGVVGGAKQIWVMNANGTGKYRLNTVWGIQAAWSPDGTKIAFKCYNNGYNICIMNANGTDVKRLTSETANTHDPDWSPDGTKIVYASQSDGDWEIYTINSNGTGKKQLTSNSGIEDNFPSWSPDGQYIAYSSNRSGNEEIWIMRINSGGTTTLSITSSSPTTNPITIVGIGQTFNINLNKNANIIWNIDGSVVKTDSGISTSNYINSTAGIGTHIVNATATNGTEIRSREWIWTVQDNIANITIISPNGGENWVNNTVRTISWNYNNNPGSFVKIELLKGEILDSIINSSIPIGSSGTGSYNWLIPSSQKLGNDYKVGITSTSNSLYNDTSNNNFTISFVTVTTVKLGITIKQDSGSVEVFRNDSGIWTSLGNTTTTKTYTVIKGTQLKIHATPLTGYIFEKYVSNNGITITTNPLIVYQNWSGSADTYFNITTG